MEISIASLSASPLFIKHSEMIFGSEERARETLRAYDKLVSYLPKLFYVANKDSNGIAVLNAKMVIGLIQQFRCLMQCCIDKQCSMSDLWESKVTGTQHCTPCNYRTMFVETSKAVCEWLPRYTEMMTERSKISSLINDSNEHHGPMLLEVDCLLEKKVFAEHMAIPLNLYG